MSRGEISKPLWIRLTKSRGCNSSVTWFQKYNEDYDILSCLKTQLWRCLAERHYVLQPQQFFYSGFSHTVIGKSVICSFLFSCKFGKESQTPEPSGAQYKFALIWEPTTYSKYPAALRKHYQFFLHARNSTTLTFVINNTKISIISYHIIN